MLETTRSPLTEQIQSGPEPEINRNRDSGTIPGIYVVETLTRKILRYTKSANRPHISATTRDETDTELHVSP
jgi:hypothetical protein